jgi:hypothetical protein
VAAREARDVRATGPRSAIDRLETGSPLTYEAALKTTVLTTTLLYARRWQTERTVAAEEPGRVLGATPVSQIISANSERNPRHF